MRIISGKYKEKKLKGFDVDGTRPTMDRLKESLFASIQIYVKNSNCLDLFAGSGALGIEAISNGANSCYFVEQNKKMVSILKENLSEIEEEIYVLHSDYNRALKELYEQNKKFDMIFLDPPYQDCLITGVIKIIKEFNLLSEDGIIVCEYEGESIQTDLECLKYKRYGSKEISIYRS